MRLVIIVLAVLILASLAYSAQVGDNTKWYNQQANVTYILPSMNATTLGFSGSTFYIYNSTIYPDNYLNFSFTTSSYATINFTALAAKRAEATMVLYRRYDDNNISMNLSTVTFSPAADEGELHLVWNGTRYSYNIANSTGRPWWAVNVSVNGAETDVMGRVLKYDSGVTGNTINSSAGVWQGFNYTPSDNYYLKSFTINVSSSTLSGTYRLPVVVFDATDSNNLMAVGGVNASITLNQESEVNLPGWVELKKGRKYYFLVYTNYSGLELGVSYNTAASPASFVACSGTYAKTCTEYNYGVGFKIYSFAPASFTPSLQAGDNNITLVATESERYIYRDFCTVANGCILYYPGEGNTTHFYDIVQGYNATQEDYNTSNADGDFPAIYERGKFGQALGTDAIDDYVKIPYSSFIYPQNITIVAVIRLHSDSYSNYWNIVQRISSTVNEGYQFRVLKTSGLLNFRFGNGTTIQSATASVPVPAYDWVFVAVTYEEPTVRLFINDTYETFSGYVGSIADYGIPVFIGKGAGANTCDCDFDEVVIFNQSLPVSTILQMYQKAYRTYPVSFKAVRDDYKRVSGTQSTPTAPW